MDKKQAFMSMKDSLAVTKIGWKVMCLATGDEIDIIVYMYLSFLHKSIQDMFLQAKLFRESCTTSGLLHKGDLVLYGSDIWQI